MKKVSKRFMSLILALPLITLVLFVTVSKNAQAQTFNTGFLAEYPYPVPGTVIPGVFPNPVNVTTHTNAYTLSHMSYYTPVGLTIPAIPAGWPAGQPYMAPQSQWMSDLTVHSWDDPGSTAGLAWINKATGSGTPGTIYDQGFMMYPPGVQDIEATIMQDLTGYAMPIFGTQMQIFVIVSFYNSNAANYAGVGHYYEVWSWNRPIPIGTGGLTFVNRVQLSNIPNYTRISQDGHNCYGFGITWEDPNAMSPTFGIAYVMGFMNNTIPGVSVSPTYVLPGTGTWTYPDIAFIHANNGLKLAFEYHKVNGVGGLIVRESDIAFVLGPPWPGANPPTVINDANAAAAPGTYAANARIDIKSCLDAPDHYSVDNWAYSYILPGVAPNDILVRFMNWNAPNFGIGATYNLTNGTLAAPTPAAITGNDWPTLAFDMNTNPSRVNVGWYTTYVPVGGAFFAPNAGGYVDLQMDETGIATSPMDYMQVALSTSGSNHDASATPSIAYSKQNDRTDYHYPVFANTMACPVTANEIQTKERPWTTAAFKGGSLATDWSGYYAAAKTSSVSAAQSTDDIVAYPNPFNTKVSLSIPQDMQEKQLTVIITDIVGKEVLRFTDNGAALNNKLNDVGRNLSNGSYVLTIDDGTDNLKKVIKLERISTK
ncbi:MAG: T9SS type A sorting domain-containing protein [Bacteroidetes bacterium]|nr:T9SS type A sorting domain-containing protein [Bacteroidota bacterium]